MSHPPFKFHDFIGQRDKVEPLIREVRGAKIRGKPACHTALSGVSGTGKSTLARALATEYGSRFWKLPGDVARSKFLAELRQVREGDFFFIDEAHGLPVVLQETLYRAIDRETIGFEDGDEPRCVPPFTLVLATDQPGGLKNALRKRIPTEVHLNPYSDREIKLIVEELLKTEDLLVTAQATNALACTCHGLPRIAEHRVRKLRYYFPEGPVPLTIEQIRQVLGAFDIDPWGFSEHQHKYVEFLYAERSASVETLAAILGVDPAFVSRQVEHPLLHQGLIAIARGGRKLTNAGIQWARDHQFQQIVEESPS